MWLEYGVPPDERAAREWVERTVNGGFIGEEWIGMEFERMRERVREGVGDMASIGLFVSEGVRVRSKAEGKV